MPEVKKLEKYSAEVAELVRGLQVQLSRSGKDKGEIPREWFEEVINSPFHDLLLAYDEGKVVGMASLSLIMGAGIRKNAYLEDFVVDANVRGRGIGELLWNAMIDWAKEKGAKRMEFTCGEGREAAQAFYQKHGAEKYNTNFFRVEL